MTAMTLPAVADEGGERALAAIADPTRDVRAGLIVAGLFFVLFLGWAALARLDAAATAPGVLAPAGQRQSVQHRDGGVIAALMVHEGQRVERGQLLLRLAAADVRAQERALSAQAIRLLAQRARLEAEAAGTMMLAPPPEFADLPTADRADAALALRMQQRELDARRATLSAQRDAFGQRSGQSRSQGRGYRVQVGAAEEQLRLFDQQLAALRPLADRGFVSQTRLRELERARAELIGQRGQYEAGVAQTAGAAQESRINAVEAERGFRERTALDLREVDTRLGDVLPRLAAARDQLARTEVRAPATGAVVGLAVFTPGGVIGPGQKLMDIVPERAPLTITARVSPDDADDLLVGQRTLVRFPTLHERDLPDLHGRLTRLSADVLTDDKTGATYFTAEIIVPEDQLRVLRDLRGGRRAPSGDARPGAGSAARAYCTRLRAGAADWFVLGLVPRALRAPSVSPPYNSSTTPAYLSERFGAAIPRMRIDPAINEFCCNAQRHAPARRFPVRDLQRYGDCHRRHQWPETERTPSVPPLRI